MIAIDWTALLMGAAAGFVLSALFFVGLAFGMRQALRRESPVSYTHFRAHETPEHLVCRLLFEKKNKHLIGA